MDLEPFLAKFGWEAAVVSVFYREVRESGIWNRPFPDLSVCIYRYVPADRDANV